MEEELRQLIGEIAKACKTAQNIVQDCPDVIDRLVNRSIKALDKAMELIVKAKNYKSDLLEARSRK